MVVYMRKKSKDICPICMKRKGKRLCPDFHQNICPSCCGPRRSEKRCTNDYCRYGFEKIWIEDTEYGKIERRVCWSPSKKDIMSEINAELIAWCYKPCQALEGKNPIDVSKTPEGKQKLIELIDTLENKVKKEVKNSTVQLVDYTPIKKELGLL